jgi:hypothetical protein
MVREAMTPVRPAALGLALVAALLGVGLALRDHGRPLRELAAVEAARRRAGELAARSWPELDALAAVVSADTLREDALSREGLVDFGLVSLDRKERGVVWHREPAGRTLPDVARALRGEEVVGELGTAGLRDPPASFARAWSLGVEGGEARVALALGRRRGSRVVVALLEVAAPVER